MSATRDHWMSIRRDLVADAERNRDSQSVSFGLLDVYDRLSEAQREDIHALLAEWLIADDNSLRYDASFLISQRQIRPLADAVEAAIAAAKSRPGVEAIYEVKKLNRILSELTV